VSYQASHFLCSVVSGYMHDPRSVHLEAVYHILRYLKGSSKGLWWMVIVMLFGLVALMIEELQVVVFLLTGTCIMVK
jgi:hypothetical protein